MRAQVPADPGWWLGRVRALGEGDAASRWRESRALARRALAYLKEAPARLLVEGLSAADPAREVLRVLADFLGDPSGRRYRIWVGCYLSGVVLSAATFGLPSDDAASFLRCLLDRWQAWSTKERRCPSRLQVSRGTDAGHDTREEARSQPMIGTRRSR